MFQIITNEKQKAFEENCIKNKVGSDENECKIPCICGYYGRACRQMNDKADLYNQSAYALTTIDLMSFKYSTILSFNLSASRSGLLNSSAEIPLMV